MGALLTGSLRRRGHGGILTGSPALDPDAAHMLTDASGPGYRPGRDQHRQAPDQRSSIPGVTTAEILAAVFANAFLLVWPSISLRAYERLTTEAGGGSSPWACCDRRARLRTPPACACYAGPGQQPERQGRRLRSESDMRRLAGGDRRRDRDPFHWLGLGRIRLVAVLIGFWVLPRT